MVYVGIISNEENSILAYFRDEVYSFTVYLFTAAVISYEASQFYEVSYIFSVGIKLTQIGLSY